jgi:1,4-alpha-glucan branching enzyme
VLLVGEFNQWNQSNMPLERRADGIWSIRAALATGRYQYRYLVDGHWVNDPAASEHVLNDFGGTNCVKIVT